MEQLLDQGVTQGQTAAEQDCVYDPFSDVKYQQVNT